MPSLQGKPLRLLLGAVAIASLGALSLAGERAAAKNPPRHNAGYQLGSLEYQSPDGEKRARKTFCWYPSAAEAKPFNYRPQMGLASQDAPVAPGRHPVILFSHGFLGGGDQTIFLLEELARQGYIVITCNHADSLAQRRERALVWPNFADPKGWDDTKYRDRRDDLVALLDHLLDEDKRAGSQFENHVDTAAIGAAGHSLGGYTVLGLMGGWEAWREKRVTAGLLMSPYVTPYLDKDRLKEVSSPVMLQGGTLDFGITPFLPKAYRGLSAPKYYLVLQGETHFAWTNLISLGKTTTEVINSGNAQLIADYSVAFFDQHLKGKAREFLDTPNDRLATYLHERR